MLRHSLRTALAFILLLAGICTESAGAENPPPGKYLQSTQPIPMGGGCFQVTMDHGTLHASCLNYFQAMQIASLPNADKCATFHGDIWNVNGFLRCVISSVPIASANPYTADIISIVQDDKSDVEEVRVLRIDQPRVDLNGPDLIRGITFKPGDMISITAGGCVQTGGINLTWKSYTQPLGQSATTLYSGTFSIQGVTGPSQRIAAVLAPKEWVVPWDLPPTFAPQLNIGYQDDNYSDNGYYNHDNGDGNQCANVGPAWIQIQIVSDLAGSKTEPKYSPHSKDFDLTWDMVGGVDANGLPLNPEWGYQIGHPGTTKTFFSSCGGGAFRFSGRPLEDTTENVGLLARCTSQAPTMDLSQNAFDMFFGICSPDHDSLFPGHLNWFIATYYGTVYWQDWSGPWPYDSDLNLGLYPSAPKLAGETSGENGISLEFKSSETLDLWGNPWWTSALTGSIPPQDGEWPAAYTLALDATAKKSIDGHLAVVTGLVGIDGVHDTGDTELHPVFALAFLKSKTEHGDSVDENWVYFIRNLGNEGQCSELLHGWPGLGTTYYVPFPWPSTSVTSVQFDNSQVWADANAKITASHGAYPGWSYLKFQFPAMGDLSLPEPLYSSLVSMVDGSVTIHYTKSSGGKWDRKEAERPNHSTDKAAHYLKLEDIVSRISDPSLRPKFKDEVLKANPEKKVARRKLVILTPDLAVASHRPPAAAGQKGLPTRDKTGKDPVAKARNEATKSLPQKYGKYYVFPTTAGALAGAGAESAGLQKAVSGTALESAAAASSTVPSVTTGSATSTTSAPLSTTVPAAGTTAAAAAAAASSAAAPTLVGSQANTIGGLACTYQLGSSTFVRNTKKAACPPTAAPPGGAASAAAAGASTTAPAKTTAAAATAVAASAAGSATLVSSQPNTIGGLACTYQEGNTTFVRNTKKAACPSTSTPPASTKSASSTATAAAVAPAATTTPAAGSATLVSSQPNASGGLACTYEAGGRTFVRNTKKAACPATSTAPASTAIAPKTKTLSAPTGEAVLIKSQEVNGKLECTYRRGTSTFTRATQKAECPATEK